MQTYDFDAVYERKGTGCFKADALQMLFGKEDLLSLWVADMDFAIAPQIQQALSERLEHPILGYNFRLPSYYKAVTDWVLQRYKWRIERDWIVNTPGIVTAINTAVVTLTQLGDGILVQTPVYDPFYHAVHNHKRRLLTNPLVLIDGRYEIDFEHFEQQLAVSKMFILCSPHNPVGRVWTRDELLQMGKLCKQYGVTVVADEIHADIIFRGHTFTPFASLEDFADITVGCYSPSKSFNLAGLCTSAIVIPSEKLRKPFSEYVQAMHLYLGNSFGITALQAAYTRGEAWLEALITYLEGNRHFLCDFMGQNLPELSVIRPEGTFLAWLDFRKLALADDELHSILVNKAGLALSPGNMYGEEGAGFMRLNFGLPKSRLEQACTRLYNTFKQG